MSNEVPDLVKDEIKKLATLPPGVTADNKAADIINVITAILNNKDVKAILPTTWQPYVLALVAALGIAGGAFVVGRASVPTPTPGPVAPVDPTPPKPAPIVPVAIAAKGGELVLIDAAKAGGDVLFNVDTKVFDARHMAIDGKKLWLVMPRADDANTYSVSVISFDDKSVTPVKIDVAGDSTPPVLPTPVDPSVTLVVIQQRLDKIDSRLTALEQIKPIPPPIPVPVPVDPFVQGLQAAYIVDGRPTALLAKLAPVYRNMSSVVDDPANTTPSKIFDILKKAVTSQAILNEPDPTRMTVMVATRLVIGAELDKTLPLKKDSTQPLDPATRNLIKTQFDRVAASLDQVK